MKTAGFRIDDGFPLSGLDLKNLIKKFGTIYTLLPAPAAFESWLSLPENAGMREAILHLVQWSGVPPTPEIAQGPMPEVNAWRDGFRELYLFFREVMKQIEEIVPTESGQDLWNTLLARRDKQLIGKLGKEVG